MGDISDHFTFTKKLGEGAYGAVWKAVDDDGKVYAVKIIQKAKDNGTALVESRMLMKLSKAPNCNKYIACIYQVYEFPKYYAIVMEYIQGKDLFDLQRDFAALRNPQLPVSAAKQILSALAYMHYHGVAHRDIKGENIIYTDGETGKSGGRIKLIDFGLSCSLKNKEDMCDEESTGTGAFMAPEVLKNNAKDWKKADMWSTGITLYELAANQEMPTIIDISKIYNRLPAAQRQQITFPQYLEATYKELVEANVKDKTLQKVIIGSLKYDPKKRLSSIEALYLFRDATKRRKSYSPKRKSSQISKRKSK